LDGEPLDIVDISAGGTHLRLKKKFKTPLKVGDTILLSLARSNDVLQKEARIIRLWRARGFHGSEHIAVKFLQPVDF
jgi:c-di-GMP-binding flagellar brake protein YcgR